MRTTSMQMSLPDKFLCRNSLVIQTDIFAAAVQVLDVDLLDMEVLTWCGHMWSVVVGENGNTAKISETPLETVDRKQMVDIPSVKLPKNFALCS